MLFLAENQLQSLGEWQRARPILPVIVIVVLLLLMRARWPSVMRKFGNTSSARQQSGRVRNLWYQWRENDCMDIAALTTNDKCIMIDTCLSFIHT